MGILRRGIYTPLVTPFVEDEVDYQALLNNVIKLNTSSIQGYLILGSSSESILLTQEERLKIIQEVIKLGRDAGKMILIGVMEESTKSAISFIAKVDKFDPDVYLILPPMYYKPSINEDTFFNFYRDLSSATEIPLFYYNVPIFSSISIDSETIIKIIKKAWIKGWKDSSTELQKFVEIIDESGSEFQSFTGNAGLLFDSLKNGSEGGILAISNALPDLCSSIYTAFSEEKFDEAKTNQSVLQDFAENVTKPFGLAGLKYAMSYFGFTGGSVRQPYSDLSKDAENHLRQFLDSQDYIP